MKKRIFLYLKYLSSYYSKIFFIFLCLLIFISSSKEDGSYYKPVVYRVQPKRGFVGDEITIYGENFGNERNKNEIFFGDTGCQDYDFDYILWSNNLIKIKVPTGAKSDYLKVQMQENTINGPYFKINNQDSHTYSDPMNITIDYTLKIHSTSNSFDKPLYVWLPSAVPGSKQREVSLVKTSKNHFQTQDDELDLFKVNNLYSAEEYYISKRFSFRNYQLKTKINSGSITNEYDFDSEFYEYYTSPQYAIESDDPKIIKLSQAIVKNEKNPYIKAKLIYDWIVENIEYQYPPPNRDWRAICALDTHKGDCAVYSFLFTALCRAISIPARPIAGHVIFINDIVSMHFWAEFYIPKHGWIPVDVNYGDVQVAGFMPKEFYFGNMDNRHIAFSKGRVKCYLPKELEGDYKEFTLKYLQKYHSYMKNKPKDKKYKIKRIIRRVLE